MTSQILTSQIFNFPDFDFPDFGFPDFELGGPVAGRLMFWFAVFGSGYVLDFGRSAVCFHVLLWTMRDLSKLLSLRCGTKLFISI